MSVKLHGKIVTLVKIIGNKEVCMESGHFSLVGLNLPAWCGSVSSGTGWRTSLVKEILQDDENVCRFKTMNNLYEARKI